MSDAYDRSLVKTALQTAQELGYSSIIQEGVYAAQLGPAFETPAECRFLSAVREKFSLTYFVDLFNRFGLNNTFLSF